MELSLVLQLAGLVLGLLYLCLEYKASIWLWLIGIIMPMVHGYLYYTKGLYADFGMNIYYIVAGIYGWMVWLCKPKKEGKPLEISQTPKRLWIRLSAVYLLLQTALYLFLHHLTDSTVPFWDAMSTALSMIAMWMLSRKYLEQWIVWILVDLISIVLYFYKGIPFTAALYSLYLLLGIAGYFRWKKQLYPQK